MQLNLQGRFWLSKWASVLGHGYVLLFLKLLILADPFKTHVFPANVCAQDSSHDFLGGAQVSFVKAEAQLLGCLQVFATAQGFRLEAVLAVVAQWLTGVASLSRTPAHSDSQMCLALASNPNTCLPMS